MSFSLQAKTIYKTVLFNSITISNKLGKTTKKVKLPAMNRMMNN
jgi:hypothetical protein